MALDASHQVRMPPSGCYNLLSDPVIEINGIITNHHIVELSIRWNNRHHLHIQSNSPITSCRDECQVNTTINHDDSTSTMVTIRSRYLVQIAIHDNRQHPSWIDIMISMDDNLVHPYGLLSKPDSPITIKDGVNGIDYENNVYDAAHGAIHVERTCQWNQSLKIWWHGPQFTFHGVATVNRELILSLINSMPQLPISITARDDEGIVLSADQDDRFSQIQSRMVDRAPNDDDMIAVQSGWEPIISPPRSGITWIMTLPWEFGIVPKDWAASATSEIDAPAQIWIPSQYVRNCYTKAGVPDDNIVVIPHGVWSDQFNHKTNHKDMFPTAKKYRFLFSGGMLARKGIDVLLSAYLKSFSPQDQVTLIIHGNYENYYLSNIKRIINDASNPHVILHNDMLTVQQVRDMYNHVHCYVMPYRSEGFGLTLLEAMAAQIPVIVTDYGPSKEYSNHDNSYLLKSVETVCDQPPCGKRTVFQYSLDGDPMWSEPSASDLSALMKHVYNNQQQAQFKALIAHRFVQSYWTWHRASRIMMKQLTKVALSRARK
ncbi:hypothetical protein AKO1_004317 [Acrasis kona]|uniref:Glycosyl transferase family 1 domain-containing protein n=1 Tax=Acrasis kona TaxID=1008807 RepID=A0AAW2Z8X8_9EUKA